MTRPETVPAEIAVCPECGGPIKWFTPEDVCCFCASSTHPPEQSAEMNAKWNDVEAKVTKWLKARAL